MMGTQLKLRGVSFSNSALPTLGSFGEIPATNLRGLYDFNSASDYLVDKSGAGNNLTIDGAASDFSFANGVLTAGTGASALKTPIQKNGLVFTGVIAMQIPVSNKFYTWRDPSLAGINQRTHPAGAVGYFYSNGAPITSEFDASALKAAGEYALYAMASDGTNIYASLDGAAWASIPIIGTVSVIPDGGASHKMEIGSAATGAPALVGGIAFAAFWETKLTDEEIRRVYQAAKGVLASKGLHI